MANSNLMQARRNKNDEFYTQLKDIENELQHYRNHFKDKVVYCNADNPKCSQFWRYFYDNFHELGLKKLTATYYGNNAEAFDYDGKDLKRKQLKGNGDFRSEESIALLEESDVVVSNPPFSLFREYIAHLEEHNKDFLIIGSMNAVTYKDVFPLLLNEEIYLGVNYGSFSFDTPVKDIKKGANVAWYTNLQEPHRPLLELTKEYNEELHPKYNDYDIINVDRVVDIPKDYDGVMGVPISFLTKHNPKQFEILGIANTVRWVGYECLTAIGDRNTYQRLLIQRK